MSILSVRNLKKTYNKKIVISDVSLEVKSKQIVGLLGPNGAGKTTCFYSIIGLIKPDYGSIHIDNINLTNKSISTRAKFGLGYLPQEASIFRDLSVEDNLLAILEMRNDLTKEDRLQRMNHLLEEFNIQHLRKNIGATLSGGERRRVEIARALTTEPRFILLDEPFAGVDPISVGDIKTIVYQLQHKGIGILITDHNVRETLDLCEYAYIVGEGKMLAEGDSEEILKHTKVRDVYLGQHFNL